MTELLIPFFGVQFAIALAAWIVYHLIRRRPDLSGRRRALDDFTDLEAWTKHALEELRESLAEMGRFKENKTSLEQRSRSSRGLGVGWAQRAFMLVFLIGSWMLLYESESGIGVVLNLTSGFLSLTRVQAAFTGPLLALGAFVIFHTAALAAHKPDRARRTWRWACAGTLAGLLAVGIAWIVFLSGRTLDATDLVKATQMEGTLTSTLYVLALLNAIAAAFVAAAILVLMEDRFLVREIERVERLIADLRDHVLRIARELKEHSVEVPPELKEELDKINEAPATSVRPSKSALITLASAILIGMIAARAEAQPVGAVAPVVNASSLQVPVRGAGACEGLFDVSLSTDDAARREAAQLFVQQLGRFIEAKSCRLFRASAFSGDPYSHVVEFEIPSVGRTAAACEPGTGVAPKRPVDTFFPNLIVARQRLAAERCTQQLRAADAAIQARRRQVVVEVGRQIESMVRTTEPRGRCTALDMSISLAHARSREVVVITDGFSNCPLSSDMAVLEEGGDFSWLTVLLIPSRASMDQRWAELAGRIAKMQSRYPGARVRPYNELTGTFWSR